MAWFGYCGSKIQNSGGHRPSLSNGEEGRKNVTQHGLYCSFLSFLKENEVHVHCTLQNPNPRSKKAGSFFLFFNFNRLIAQTWSLRTRLKRWKSPQLWNLGPLYTSLQTRFIVMQDGATARAPDSTLLSFLPQRSDFFIQCQFWESLCIAFSSHAPVSASQARW